MTVRSVFLLAMLFFVGTALAQDSIGPTNISSDKLQELLAKMRAEPVDSKMVDAALEIGFDLVAAGRYQEGLVVFAAIIDAAPTDYRAQYGRALASFNLGQIRNAEEQIRATIDSVQSPSNLAPLARYGRVDALVLLGVILAVKGDSAGALSAVTEAARIAPNSFDAQFALGRALYGSGDPKNAARAFERAIALKPTEIQSRFFLATALEATGEYGKAQKAYSDLISTQPEKAEGHLGLGVLLVKLGGERTEEGIQELKKAISLNGDLYEACVTLGRVQVRLGRFSEALENLARAAQLAPNNPEPHYQMAIAYRRLGNRTAAEHESSKVKEINSRRRGIEGSKGTANKAP